MSYDVHHNGQHTLMMPVRDGVQVHVPRPHAARDVRAEGRLLHGDVPRAARVVDMGTGVDRGAARAAGRLQRPALPR